MRSTLITFLAILVATMSWAILGEPVVSLIILCGIAIIAPAHAVRLYWENDSMIGGLPRANYSYTIGLVILAAGNVITCLGFLYPFQSNQNFMIYLGSLLMLAGIGTLVAASSLLFQHIARRGLKSA